MKSYNIKFQMKLFSIFIFFLVAISTVFGETLPGCTTYITGDVSGPQGQPDCYVNILDLKRLGQSWLSVDQTVNLIDVVGETAGRINFFDISKLAGNWMRCNDRDDPNCMGAYPSTQDAGFSHCVLIYEKQTRTHQDLKPYAAKTINGTAQQQWLFDSFLFLIQKLPNGKRTEYSTTDKADWEYLLDTWFSAGRDLQALDQAIANVEAELGITIPSNRTIIFGIPWLDPNLTNFGDVDGDGVSENLTIVNDRKKVFEWFVNEAETRFNNANFDHLSLWGFYWMREDIVTYSDIVKEAAEVVHSNLYKFLFIPYYLAPGWDISWNYDLDISIMQPSYAFRTWIDGGRVRRNRLWACADVCKKKGLGVEVEARGHLQTKKERKIFLQTLADGASGKCGYQNAATAYYLGYNSIELISNSSDTEQQQAYAALCDYIAGSPVPDPDPPVEWTQTASGSEQVFETQFSLAQNVSFIDIFFDETGQDKWLGKAIVSVKSEGQTVWEDGGWALRAGPDTYAGTHQVINVPICKPITAAKVTLQKLNTASDIQVKEITFDSNSRKGKDHLAYNTSYTISPLPQTAAYGDAGSELIDGVIPLDGNLSAHVGWEIDPGYVGITFDLGGVHTVDQLVLYARGGGIYAINWPLNPVAIVSQSKPYFGVDGLGALPSTSVQVSTGSKLIIDRTRSDRDMDGHVAFDFATQTSGRYVTVFAEGRGWLMLSEVQIISGGLNIAGTSTYSYHPMPTVNSSSYPDDGMKLTDGFIADGYYTGIVGWEQSGIKNIQIDLDEVKDVNSVELWSLGGGQYGIYAPKNIAVALSQDGTSWTAKTPMPLVTAIVEDGSKCEAVTHSIDFIGTTQARYLLLDVERTIGWAMLSEVVVK